MFKNAKEIYQTNQYGESVISSDRKQLLIFTEIKKSQTRFKKRKSNILNDNFNSMFKIHFFNLRKKKILSDFFHY